MARFLSCHGDSVRDIAFTVNDCHAAFNVSLQLEHFEHFIPFHLIILRLM